MVLVRKKPAMVAKRVLMPHQQEAFHYAKPRQHAAFIMEMRLGKTIVSIRWVQAMNPPVETIIVLAPLTVLETWENELKLEGERYTVLAGLLKPQRQATLEAFIAGSGRRWLLMNYETLLASMDIAGMPWDVVLADESTRLKNPEAQTTQVCVYGFRLAKHRAILTGLPSPEGMLNLFSQFKFLYGSFMGCTTYWQFKASYFELDGDGKSYVPKTGVAKDIITAVHNKAFVRTRKQCNLGSRKIYETRNVSMTPVQKKLYQQVEEEFAATLESGETLETNYIIVKLTWLSRIAGGFDPEGNLLSSRKAKEILELLQGELYGEKVVIWFRYNAELHLVRSMLEEAGIGTLSITGEVPQDKRKERLERFRNGKTKVLLCQIKCAKYGVDCSSASTAIYHSCSYSCEEQAQSEDRIVHPMKKEPLLYIFLATKGSIDHAIIHALKKKIDNAQLTMIDFRSVAYSLVENIKNRRRGRK